MTIPVSLPPASFKPSNVSSLVTYINHIYVFWECHPSKILQLQVSDCGKNLTKPIQCLTSRLACVSTR